MEEITSKVDLHIQCFPEPARGRLKALREMILGSNDKIEERWSYGMPAYFFEGSPLLYFTAFKNHIGLYATPQAHTAFSKALSGYKQGKGSVQFPHDQELPMELVKQILHYKLDRLLEQARKAI